MQSNNPIFTRSEGFSGRGNAPSTYPQSTGYTNPSEWGTGASGGPVTQVDQGRMTIDSVVQKTGLTLGVVVLVAAATWVLSGDITTDPQKLQALSGLAGVGAIGGFVLAMVNTFKRAISPALVLVYAVFQGLFVGGISKVLETVFTDPGDGKGGLVIGAVLGTMAAVGGTLAAYKFFDIQVGQKFRTWVIAAGFGFLAVTLLDVVLGAFGNSLGVNGFGPLGFVFSLLGLGLGVLFLILDFDFVERGIAAGLPERESWRAAFGLTATIVFIYIEILRILAILRGD